MRTILVTGGAGFIGANLVHHLARSYPEDRIVVLDLLTYAGSIEHLPQEMLQGRHPRLRFWYGNVCNAALVDMLVNEADVVLHLAAFIQGTATIGDHEYVVRAGQTARNMDGRGLSIFFSHIERLRAAGKA